MLVLNLTLQHQYLVVKRTSTPRSLGRVRKKLRKENNVSPFVFACVLGFLVFLHYSCYADTVYRIDIGKFETVTVDQTSLVL